MNAWVLIILLAIFVVIFLALLAFTIIFPSRWAKLIDREHEFFLKCGLVSEPVSRNFKCLEKGIVIKLALAGTILVELMDLTVVVMRCVFGYQV